MDDIGIDDFEWINICATFQVDGTHKVYINGIQTASGNFELSNNLIGITEGLHCIGNNTDNRFFNGNIDNLSLWNKTLSQLEIENNILCSSYENEDGLISYWNFEEGPEEGQVIDVSGNGNNGTINGATYSEDVPEQNCSNSCDEIEIDGFTYGGYFNGSNYYLSSNSYTWIESNEISNSLNGHLVTINLKKKMNLLAILIIIILFG